MGTRGKGGGRVWTFKVPWRESWSRTEERNGDKRPQIRAVVGQDAQTKSQRIQARLVVVGNIGRPVAERKKYISQVRGERSRHRYLSDASSNRESNGKRKSPC